MGENSVDSQEVHMCLEIPPKYAVSSIIGFMKGESAIAIAKMSGKQRNFNGENFWARGYAVSTVGYDIETIKKYFRDQEESENNETNR
jgi:putative transposase